MSRCDVAIVGAGPAGAFAAYLLARRGARVRLFDPSHPREKPCGGGVTGRALALVAPAIGLNTLDGVAVRSARFEAGDPSGDHGGRGSRSDTWNGNGNGSGSGHGTPNGHARRTARAMAHAAAVDLNAHGIGRDSSLVVMSRAAFDRALLQGAVDAGAEHDASRVTDVQATHAGATVTTAAGVWQADHVIGADGANSFVRRRLSRPFTRAQLSIATGFFAHGVTSPEIVIRFVSNPDGYIWSFPRATHLAIGICAQADVSRPGPLKERVAQWIHASGIAPGARLEPYSWPIPSLSAADFDREQPAGPRWMLAGDAAGLVDPITREGIYFALQSAMFAAEALTRSPGDSAAAYRDALHADVYPELRRAARTKRHFFRGPFTRLLIDALRRSEPVRAIMRDLVAGEQPYRTLRRRLLGTFELRLAWQLLLLQLGGRA